MKRPIQRLSLVLAFWFAGCSAPKDGTIVEDFNFGWEFSLANSGAELTDIPTDQKAWREVRLPHDWSIEEGYTQEMTAGSNAFLPGGIGWYRKSFKLSSDLKDRENLLINFDGVYNNSKVWVNGEYLGESVNGYLDFRYDLDEVINRDGENEIVVYVDRRAYADSRWYVGGGIYRNVELVGSNEIYIPKHGVMVNPVVDGNNAQINVVTSIDNHLTDSADLIFEQKILAGDKCVSTNVDTLRVRDNFTTDYKNALTLENPTLWSLENPTMYTLQTTITHNGSVVEKSSNTFGVRTIEFNTNKGFLLNGESVKIKGVNIHHDLGSVGVALYDDVLYRRLAKLRAMGCNAIRTAHNPHSESLLNMCDTMGLLVMNEFIDEWKEAKSKWITQRSKNDAPKDISVGYSAHFEKHAERDIKRFIKRDRNHPSVILWSIGNEIEWTYPYYWAASKDNKGVGGLIHTGDPETDNKAILDRFNKLSGGKDELSETAKSLVEWVKEVDDTRPVTSGVVIPSVSRLSGYTDVLDVVGYNYKDKYYDVDHKLYPEQPILGTENVGQYFEWKAVADKEYIPGIFVWTGIDYMGENGPWPLKGALYSFFDFACHKTPRGHFFEALWNETPKTHIVTTPSDKSEFKLHEDGTCEVNFRKSPLRRWEWFDTFDKWNYSDNEMIMVQAYTNAPQVELLLNGKSLGTKNRADFAEENILLWEVPYEAGEIVAVGKDGDKELSRYSLSTPSAASKIALTADKAELKSDGYNMLHIEMDIMDDKGTLITDLPENLTIEVDGKTIIKAVDNGSCTFVGSHTANTITTHNGHALAIIQAKVGASGSSTITVKSDSGLENSIKVKYNK